MELLNLGKLPHPVNEMLTFYFDALPYTGSKFLRGFYLTGSVPLLDFHNKKSDVDFVAVMKQPPDKRMLEQLEEIHEDMAGRFKPHFSGYYLTEMQLQMPHVINTDCPASLDGKFVRKADFELSRIKLYELKHASLRIAGPDVEELGIRVRVEEVRRQLYENINSYWAGWIDSHSFPMPKSLLLLCVPRLTEWGILGVARQLYTLQTGSIVSKADAGFNIMHHLPENHRRAVKQAVAIRQKNKTEFRFSIRRYRRTIKAMKYIVDEFNILYKRQ